MKKNYFIYFLGIGVFLNLLSCNEPSWAKSEPYKINQKGAVGKNKPEENLSQKIDALIKEIKVAPSLSKLDDLTSNASSLMNNQRIAMALREKKLELLRRKLNPLKDQFQKLKTQQGELEEAFQETL